MLATSPDAVWWGGALVAAVIGAGFLLSGDRIPEPLAVEAGVPDVGEEPRSATQALTSGDYERHIVRARHAYRRRRDLLLDALTARFPRLQVSGAAAGMQLLLPLPGQTDDIGLAHAAAARGIGIDALSSGVPAAAARAAVSAARPRDPHPRSGPP